jgi:ribonuclease HI
MPAPAQPRYQVYTDGGADPNPGPAGWGAVILDQATGAVRELSGAAAHATNNRMELTAAIRALEALPPEAEVAIHTDSIYLKKGVTEWLPRWIARGWRRRTGELRNEDLWRELAARTAGRRVSWSWVKGHAGHRHNERADRLAAAEIRALKGRDQAPRSRVEPPEVEVFLRVSGGGERGGWAAAVRRRGQETGELATGALRGASANELDLQAAAAVLESLPEGIEVAVHTGSDYLRNGATRWLDGWRSGGWRTKAGTPVQNRAAWERLARAMARRRVSWPPVKGDLPAGWQELGKAAREAAG